MDAGGGALDLKAIRDLKRLRWWVAYAHKHQADDLEVLASGALAGARHEQPPPVVRPPDPAPPKGRSAKPQTLRERAGQWLAGAWRRWGTRRPGP
jgi:hypothetical protein